MEARDLSWYGGEKVNRTPVENSETDVSEQDWNRNTNDTGAMSRTSVQVRCEFTATTGATGDFDPNWWRTHWGNSTGQKPTIEKVATGRYKVKLSSTYAQEYGDDETVSLVGAEVQAWCASTSEVVKAQLYAVSATEIELFVKEFSGGSWSNVDQTTGAVAIKVIVGLVR